MTPTAVLGYSMGGVVALRATAEADRVTALVLLASAGIVSTSRRARAWLGVTGLLRPARRAARARSAIARRPSLRAVVFGGWGAEDPQALSAEAVHGFLDAQHEHADVKCSAGAHSR